MSEFPKLFKESDLKCFCHVKNKFAISTSKPADKLCKNCLAGLGRLQNQYYGLVEGNPVDNVKT